MGEMEIGVYHFEWDDEKNRKNFQKHKIKFEDAAWVFLDEFRIDDYDELHSDFEERIKVIGRVRNILAVIYTERGDKYRIISARKADRNEVEEYNGQFYY